MTKPICNPIYFGRFQCMCQTSNTISGKSLQHAELQTKNAKSKSKWKLSSFDNVGSKYTDKQYCKMEKGMQNEKRNFFNIKQGQQKNDLLNLNVSKIDRVGDDFKKIEKVDQLTISILTQPQSPQQPKDVFTLKKNHSCTSNSCNISGAKHLSESLPWTLHSLDRKANKQSNDKDTKKNLRGASRELCQHFFSFTEDSGKGKAGAGYYEKLNFLLGEYAPTCFIPVWEIGSKCRNPDQSGNPCYNALKNTYKKVYDCSGEKLSNISGETKKLVKSARKEILSAIAGYVETVDAFTKVEKGNKLKKKFKLENRCNQLTLSGMLCTTSNGEFTGLCNSEAYKDLSRFDKALKKFVANENISSISSEDNSGNIANEKTRRKMCSLCHILAPLNEMKDSSGSTFSKYRGFGTHKKYLGGVMKTSLRKTLCHNLMMGQGFKYRRFSYKGKLLNAPRPKASVFGVNPSWNVYCPPIKVETKYSGHPGGTLKRTNWSELIKASNWPTGRSYKDVSNNKLFGSSISGVHHIINGKTSIHSLQKANDQLIKKHNKFLSSNPNSSDPCAPSVSGDRSYYKFARIDSSGNFLGVGHSTQTNVPKKRRFNSQKHLYKVTGNDSFLNKSIKTNLGGGNRKRYGPKVFVPFYEIYSCSGCPSNSSLSKSQDKCKKK